MIEAFSPGSVTLFFEIRERKGDLKRTGSRGVGVCVSSGVRTRIFPGKRLEVCIDGEVRKNTIQEEVAKRMGFVGRIESIVELPVSQGFGMSGAAALSTALAIAKLKGISYLTAARVAHEVEVRRKSGLGDVATQYEGGFTLRLREGIQPFGVVDRLFYPPLPIFLIVFRERGIETHEILSDPQEVSKIKKEGYRAMRSLLQKPTWKNALKVAREFSFRTGLISEEMRDFLNRCENSTAAMIGNSAIVFGECKEEIFDNYKVYRVELGERARIGI